MLYFKLLISTEILQKNKKLARKHNVYHICSTAPSTQDAGLLHVVCQNKKRYNILLLKYILLLDVLFVLVESS